jgi:hypothetical protein
MMSKDTLKPATSETQDWTKVDEAIAAAQAMEHQARAEAKAVIAEVEARERAKVRVAGDRLAEALSTKVHMLQKPATSETQDWTKVDEAIAAAQAMEHQARAAAKAAMAEAEAATQAKVRVAERALAEAMADRVHMLCQQGGRMPEITAKYRCSGWVYNTARKIGERNAAAREAAARAEADAALAGAGILVIQTAPDASAEASDGEKVMLRGVADALAEIVHSALSAYGIKVINNKINRSVNRNRGHKRCGREQPTFCVEFGTDWRPEDGILTPPSMIATSAASANEISSLHAALARAQAQIAMAQAQLDSMIAAKAGKP